MTDPFPMRASGTRFDDALGSSPRCERCARHPLQAQNPNVSIRASTMARKRPARAYPNMAVEIAYTAVAAIASTAHRQDYLLSNIGWCNVRNHQQNLLNANVTNRFYRNFESLRRRIQRSTIRWSGILFQQPHHSAP